MRPQLFVITFLWATASAAAPSTEIDLVEQTFHKCLESANSPETRLACTSHARRKADEAIENLLRTVQPAMKKEGQKDPRTAAALRYLSESQAQWTPFRVSQCHFLVELNRIEPSDLETRYETCLFTMAKERYQSFLHAVWK